jgi:hypothetical protein
VSAARLFLEEQRSRLEHDDARPCGQRKRPGPFTAQQPETRRSITVEQAGLQARDDSRTPRPEDLRG